MVAPETIVQREELIGRETELDSIGAFLDGTRVQPGALVLEGEAGAGKTALWLAALELASERGIRVLEGRPAEAEAKLAFAGLADLLEGVLDDVLQALPEPQGAALRVALLHERPGPDALDERAVGMGLLGSLRALGASGPVIVAVDDVQWLGAGPARGRGGAVPRRAALVSLGRRGGGRRGGAPPPPRTSGRAYPAGVRLGRSC